MSVFVTLLSGIFWLVDAVLGVYAVLIIVYVVVMMLISLGIVSAYGDVIRRLMAILAVTVGILLDRIRRYVPLLGGLDFSPLVALAVIWVLRALLHQAHVALISSL